MDNIEKYFNNFNFKDTFDIYKTYDELMLLNTGQLLELFDIEDETYLDEDIAAYLKYYFQGILKNMSNNVRSKCYKRVEKYKTEYNYLPDINEDNFQEKLSIHRELWLNRYRKNNSSKCDIDFFQLLNHQIYLKNILSPYSTYNGMLLFHGVGVGKTCSAITIAETYADMYINEQSTNKVIILASENIQVGWRKNIADPYKLNEQCTGNKYLPSSSVEEITLHRQEKIIKKNIKSKYEFFTYRKFASSIKKHVNKNSSDYNTEEELIKDKYSNRVLIIDEVHNIRSVGTKDDVMDVMNFIEKVIRYSENLKLILLTATPMFNMPSEIIWIINMLRINDGLKSLNIDDYFNNEKFIDDKKLEFIDKCQGYISYLRGENPDTFPIRLYPKGNNILSPKNNPDLSLYGIKIPRDEKLTFSKLYSSNVSGDQKKYYNICINKLKSDIQNKDDFKPDDFNKVQMDTYLRQMSNIVYPYNSDNYLEHTGDKGFDNNFNYSKGKFTYKKTCLDTVGEFLAYDKIQNYSSKIHSIINLIDNTDGILFIYSNWINSGVIPLCLALEQHGYTNINGKKHLECSQTDPMSYDGRRKSDFENPSDFIQGKYALLSVSEKIENSTADVLKISNDMESGITSEGNKNGKNLKIIIGTSVASEGLDFKCIRSIHIMEPWLNLNKLEQVIGRGVRNCSHKSLDESERNTTIYLHVTGLDNRESIDTYLYRYSESKSLEIGKVETMLKQSAIDLYLSKDINVLNKTSKNIKLQPALRNSKSRIKNIKDEKYSRVCSFREKCNYFTVKQSSYTINKTTDNTLNIHLLDNMINNIKRHISFLYTETICYYLSDIIDKLKEYIDIDEYIDLIYITIHEMTVGKYQLKSFNNLGYLILIDAKLIFQPNFNNDKTLSNYYRINSGNYFNNNYIITNTNEINIDKHLDISITDCKNIAAKIKKYIYTGKTNTYFNKTEIQILDSLDFNEYIQIGYIFDHLTFNDKKILLFRVINILKSNAKLSDFDNLIIDYCKQFFIHYGNSDIQFYYAYGDVNNPDISGFFLFNPNLEQELYYKVNQDSIDLYSEIDKIYIDTMITNLDKSKLFNTKKNWGFTIFSNKLKFRNGIALKVVKPNTKIKKKYKFPESPGVVVNGGNTEWSKDATYTYLTKELYQNYDDLSSTIRTRIEKIYNKDDYIFIIEHYLRKINKLHPYDIIWIKYKFDT
jgi:hypothetical protein